MTALLQFAQGPNTDIAGRAVAGTLSDGSVTVSNGDDSGVVNWHYELLYVPPGSAIPLASQSGAAPTFSFAQPDVPGSYRVRLTTTDALGAMDVDIRNLMVPFPNGIFAPPFQGNPLPLPLVGPNAKPSETNLGGQPFGWDGDADPSRVLLYQALQILDGLIAAGGVTSAAGAGSVTVTPSSGNVTVDGAALLPRDGSRPMTGDLDLDGQSVIDADDIAAATGTFTGSVLAADFNGVALTDSGSAGTFLNAAGIYSVVSPIPAGPAGGQLGGNYPDPDVRGLRETAGPTLLTLGALADGEFLQRVGATLVGGNPTIAPGAANTVLWSNGSANSFTSSPWLGTSLAIGSAPAASGALRLTANQAVTSANSTAGVVELTKLNASDEQELHDGDVVISATETTFYPSVPFTSFRFGVTETVFSWDLGFSPGDPELRLRPRVADNSWTAVYVLPANVASGEFNFALASENGTRTALNATTEAWVALDAVWRVRATKMVGYGDIPEVQVRGTNAQDYTARFRDDSSRFYANGDLRMAVEVTRVRILGGVFAQLDNAAANPAADVAGPRIVGRNGGLVYRDSAGNLVAL